MNNFIKEFMDLFAGRHDAYGTYDPNATTKTTAKGGKVEIKKTARTIRGDVTSELWALHLVGKTPLGIIPIKADGSCSWGCIDIDDYTINHAAVAEAIIKHNMPLVPCKTKSGGLHLFLFLSVPAAAEDVQVLLRDMAGVLGYGTSEIFPKQSQVLTERGDVGNWLNMPYFGGDKTDRYGIKKTSAAMSMLEFIQAAKLVRTDISSVHVAEDTEADFSDGPPCLQYLTSIGFEPGSRNAGLFALGTFAKKKYGEKWKDVLEEFNRKYMNPPLPSDEVQEVIKNLSKKVYEYKCKDAPINAHCNSILCRTKKFGVGGGKSNSYPLIQNLSVLQTEPPLWFMDINEKRVELTTDQLHNYPRFQQVCMEALHVVFMRLKQDTWLEMLGTAMEGLVAVEAPPEASSKGAFEELLSEFCVNRYKAENKEEVVSGKPWEDEDQGRYYFRLKDLMEQITRAKFTWGRNKVSSYIMDLGGGQEQFNIKGTLIRVMWVPNKMFKAEPTIDLPVNNKVPI